MHIFFVSSPVVTIRNAGGTTFRGFLVQAQNPAGDQIGTFVPQASNNNQQLLDCTASSQPAMVSLLWYYLHSSIKVFL